MNKPNLKIFIALLALLLVSAGCNFIKKGSNQNSSGNQTPAAAQAYPRPAGIPNDWQLYSGANSGLQFYYPTYLNVGQMSKNSVLGTYQVPIPGLFVGKYVFVAVSKTDATITNEAQQYFDGYDKIAFDTPDQASQHVKNADGPTASCYRSLLPNPNLELNALTCTGEGGPAYYVLAQTAESILFIDGYSQGYGGISPQAQFKTDADFEKVASTIRFAN